LEGSWHWSQGCTLTLEIVFLWNFDVNLWGQWEKILMNLFEVEVMNFLELLNRLSVIHETRVFLLSKSVIVVIMWINLEVWTQVESWIWIFGIWVEFLSILNFKPDLMRILEFYKNHKIPSIQLCKIHFRNFHHMIRQIQKFPILITSHKSIKILIEKLNFIILFILLTKVFDIYFQTCH